VQQVISRSACLGLGAGHQAEAVEIEAGTEQAANSMKQQAVP